MTSKKPLSYLSMQCVLQHLGASARFQLVTKNSSLQNLEKSLPLKIETLRLEYTEMGVNNTTYRLGIIRLYNNQETPEEILFDNRNGGVRHDVDRYGFQINEDVEEEPEEVIIDDRYEVYEGRLIEREEYMKYNLNTLEQESQKLEKFQETEQLTLRELSSLKSLEKEIKKYKNKLLPYNLRRKNAPSQSTNYIQLTISNVAGKRVERISYSKSIYVAMKYLIEKLLRERREAIKISTFVIGHHGLLHLPLNLKLKIEELDIHTNHRNILNAIEPILIKGSLPLKSIHIHEPPLMENFIIQSAKQLFLSCDWDSINLEEMKNHRVNVCCIRLPSLQVMRLLRDWLRNKRQKGTCYSFNVDDDAVETFGEIANFAEARIGENRQATVFFPMSDTLEVKISCTLTQQNRRDWDFIMEVQEK